MALSGLAVRPLFYFQDTGIGRGPHARAGEAVAAELLDRVRAIATPIVEFAGMELVLLELKREAGGWVLRLFLDKEGGVTLDDCSRISRQLSAQLDVEDPIQQRYTLEVSSPGLDRPLVAQKDYLRFAGRRVRVSTRTAIDGQRNFAGRLDAVVEGSVRLVLDGDRQVTIALDNVAKARLEIDIKKRDDGPMRGQNS